MGIVVQVPVDTCRHRQLAVTLDTWLAVLRSDDKDILTILSKACINHNFKFVGRAVTTNTVKETRNSLLWSSYRCLGFNRLRHKNNEQRKYQCHKKISSHIFVFNCFITEIRTCTTATTGVHTALHS